MTEKKHLTAGADSFEPIQAKFLDAMTPGFLAAFDPSEAELAGAFVEDALTEQDAVDSRIDLLPWQDQAIAGGRD